MAIAGNKLGFCVQGKLSQVHVCNETSDKSMFNVKTSRIISDDFS